MLQVQLHEPTAPAVDHEVSTTLGELAVPYPFLSKSQVHIQVHTGDLVQSTLRSVFYTLVTHMCTHTSPQR